jgi:hypothetical protein
MRRLTAALTAVLAFCPALFAPGGEAPPANDWRRIDEGQTGLGRTGAVMVWAGDLKRMLLFGGEATARLLEKPE